MEKIVEEKEKLLFIIESINATVEIINSKFAEVDSLLKNNRKNNALEIPVICKGEVIDKIHTDTNLLSKFIEKNLIERLESVSMEGLKFHNNLKSISSQLNGIKTFCKEN